MIDQIWLTGFMGTGKSRISRPLAAALDWRAIDIDSLVVERAGETIDEIFTRGGVAAFRVLESEAIAETAELAHVVVATGGGSVLAASNRAAMSRRGFVVCLDARPDTILARIRGASGQVSDRPLLRGEDPLTKIVELKAERQPLYAQADFIIQTDDLTPDQVTHQVLLAYREQAAASAGHPV
jgi:shikimate kinase